MKINIKKYAALFFALCTVLLVMSGCMDELVKSLPIAEGKGLVSLSISDGSTNGRTIMPAYVPNFGSFRITVYHNAGGETGYVVVPGYKDFAYTNPIPLDEGSYKIEVKAYTDAAHTNLAGEGETETDVVVKQGATVSRHITVRPLQNGNGTFEWELTFDASITAATMNIGAIDGLQGIDVKASAGKGTKSVPSGYHKVTFNLTGPDVEWIEELLIYDSMVSKFTHAFGNLNSKALTDIIEAVIKKTDTTSEITYHHFDIAGIQGVDETNDTALLSHISWVRDLATSVDIALIKLGLAAEQYESEEEVDEAILGFVSNSTVIANIAFPSTTSALLTISGLDEKVTVTGFSIVSTITSFTVNVGGEHQAVTLTNMKGNNTSRILVSHGYQQTQTAGHQSAYSSFKIDLGTRKLAEFGTVKVTVEGVSGDVGWKKFTLRAADDIPNNSGDITLVAAVSTESTQSPGASPAVPYSGTVLTVEILQNTNTKALTGPIDVAIYIPADPTGAAGGAGSPTKFKITNIEFDLGQSCEYCSAFPCECPTTFNIAVTGKAPIQVPVANLVTTGTAAVKGIAGGFEVSNSNNNYGLVQIPIALAGGKKFEDIETIEVTLMGKAGEGDDRPYYFKNYLLLAGETAIPSPWTNASEIAVPFATGNKLIDTDIEMSYVIDSTKAASAALEGKSSFVIAFAANIGAAARYTFTDIVITYKEVGIIIGVEDFHHNVGLDIDGGIISILSEDVHTVRLTGITADDDDEENILPIKWFLNGDEVSKFAGKKTFVIPLGKDAMLGKNVLSVEVVLDGKTYRKNVVYTIGL